MTTNVVLCYPVQPRHLAQFSELVPNVNIINAGQEGIQKAIFDADVFIGHAKVPVDWEAVIAQNRLRFIQSSAAGLDHCLVPSVIESDVTVCSASGLFANQVGEQTMSLLLGLLRGLPKFFHQNLRKEFVRQPTDDLHGKRVGIVGFGGNGRRLAELLESFQVEIRATDYYPVRKPDSVCELLPADQLEYLAQNSDILILALPLNASTHKIISAEILHAMPPGGYLINVARGRVVDESALVDALADGHLAGAGLDVTFDEPLPPESPLWNAGNVLITPHVGAQSARRVDDSTRFACENLNRFLRNRPLLNAVDKRLGFPHPDRMANQHRS